MTDALRRGAAKAISPDSGASAASPTVVVVPPQQSSLPVWLLPAAVGVGAFLLLRKK